MCTFQIVFVKKISRNVEKAFTIVFKVELAVIRYDRLKNDEEEEELTGWGVEKKTVKRLWLRHRCQVCHSRIRRKWKKWKHPL